MAPTRTTTGATEQTTEPTAAGFTYANVAAGSGAARTQTAVTAAGGPLTSHATGPPQPPWTPVQRPPPTSLEERPREQQVFGSNQILQPQSRLQLLQRPPSRQQQQLQWVQQTSQQQQPRHRTAQLSDGSSCVPSMQLVQPSSEAATQAPARSDKDASAATRRSPTCSGYVPAPSPSDYIYSGGESRQEDRDGSAAAASGCSTSRACGRGGDDDVTWEPVALLAAAVRRRAMEGAGSTLTDSAAGAVIDTAASTAAAPIATTIATTWAIGRVDGGLTGSRSDSSSLGIRHLHPNPHPHPHHPQVLLPPLLVCAPPPAPPCGGGPANPEVQGAKAAETAVSWVRAGAEHGSAAVGALPGLLLGGSPPCSSAISRCADSWPAMPAAMAAMRSGGHGGGPMFLHVPPVAARQQVNGMVPSSIVCGPADDSSLSLLAGASQVSATPSIASDRQWNIIGGAGGGDWMPSSLAALALASYPPSASGTEVVRKGEGQAAATSGATGDGGDSMKDEHSTRPWLVWDGPVNSAAPCRDGAMGPGSGRGGRRRRSSDAVVYRVAAAAGSASRLHGSLGAGSAYVAAGPAVAPSVMSGQQERPLSRPKAPGNPLRATQSYRLSPASQDAMARMVDGLAAAAAQSRSPKPSAARIGIDSAPAEVAPSRCRATSAATFIATTPGGARGLLQSISGRSLDSPGGLTQLFASGKGVGGTAVVPLPAGRADDTSATTERAGDMTNDGVFKEAGTGMQAADGVNAGACGSKTSAAVASSSTESTIMRWQRAGRTAGLAASVARSFRTLRNQHDENLVREDQLQVVGEIGAGTFARVDKCLYSPPSGAIPFPVAVKRIKSEVLQVGRSDDDGDDLQLFLQEAQLLRKLNHPHIVEYVGIGIVTESSQLMGLDELDALWQAPMSASRAQDDRNLRRHTSQRKAYESRLPCQGGLRQRRRSSGEPLLQWDRGLAAKAVPVVHPVLRDLFIVEEYMGGGTLKNAVYQQMLQPQHQLYSNATALRWMAQVAGALSYMHNCRPKVLHRDIKLDNVLLTSCADEGPDSLNGCAAKLGDLGLAALISEHRLQRLGGSGKVEPDELKLDLPGGSFVARKHSDMSQAVRQRVIAAGQAPPHLQAADSTVQQRLTKILESHKRDRLGTYMYMAPEVYRRQKYDEKCDCFSFAIVLYEVFHRYIVACSLEAPSQMEKYARQVAYGFRPTIHDDLPMALRRLIKQCWAQDPAARPDMATVAQELWSLGARGALVALDRKQQGAGLHRCCVVS